MNIIKDVDLITEVDKYDVILVGTNTYYALNNGFQGKVASTYPYVVKTNETIRYGDTERMGTVLEAKEDGKPLFCLLYVANGYGFRPDLKKEFLDYDSLERCLKIVNILYKGKNVATTLIGCSPFDGNGNQEKVLSIIEKTLTDCNITIYDYVQKSIKEEQREEYLAHKNMGREAFYQYIKERKLKRKNTKKNDSGN